VSGDGLPDILVTNKVGGDVTVFLNDPGHTFTTRYRFRGGIGLYGLDTSAATPAVSALVQSIGLATGDFTRDGQSDVVVINRGARSLTILPGEGNGVFGNPQGSLPTSTSDGAVVNQQPGPVVSGDLNGDGSPDLAILMEDRAEVWIYTDQGQG